MQFNDYLKIKAPKVILFGLLFGLVSCGSYQYVGVDTDGIYNDSSRRVPYEEAVVEVSNQSKNNYYEDYFKSSNQYLDKWISYFKY